jgi:hypothetical protein
LKIKKVLGLCILLAALLFVSACQKPVTPITHTETTTVTTTPATPDPVKYSDTVVIAPNQLQNIPLRVTSSNRVEGSFTIQGGSGNDVVFNIVDPFGNKTLVVGLVKQSHSFAFVAATSGSYVLSFDNSFSSVSNKVVKYSYTVYWR